MPVRWNSTYLMLERMYEQMDAVNELINEHETNDGHAFTNEDKKAFYSILCVFKYYYYATL